MVKIPKQIEAPERLSVILSVIVSLLEFVPMFLSQLDLELTITLAFILFLLQYIAFTLILDAKSRLQRIEKLVSKNAGVIVDLADFENLEDRIRRANYSLWIEGLSFNVLLGTSYRVLEKMIEKGCKLKLLLTDPEKAKDTSLMYGAQKHEIESQILTSILKIEDFVKKYKKNIEARILPSYLGFGVFIIDGEQDDGEIKVELLPKNAEYSKRPNFIITRKEPKRYLQFITHFNALFEESSEIDFDKYKKMKADIGASQ